MEEAEGISTSLSLAVKRTPEIQLIAQVEERKARSREVGGANPPQLTTGSMGEWLKPAHC